MWCSESLHGTAPYSITKDPYNLRRKAIAEQIGKPHILSQSNN